MLESPLVPETVVCPHFFTPLESGEVGRWLWREMAVYSRAQNGIVATFRAMFCSIVLPLTTRNNANLGGYEFKHLIHLPAPGNAPDE